MATALFVCLHNAGRSQMSAALFERAAAGRHRALSAGSEADPGGRVHPEVVDGHARVGVDLADARAAPLSDDLVAAADVVVTMGCGDACPYLPGKRYVDWELEDPRAPPSRTSAPPATRSPAASTRWWRSSTGRADRPHAAPAPRVEGA